MTKGSFQKSELTGQIFVTKNPINPMHIVQDLTDLATQF